MLDKSNLKNVFLICCLLVTTSSFAQKRNNLQLVGFGYDQWSNDDYTKDVGEFLESVGRFTYIAGYERLIGDRLALGLTYHFIIPSVDNTFYDFQSYRPLRNLPSTYSNTYYSFSGFNIGYDSKYYFQEFDEDGANGFYIGCNYQYSTITESGIVNYDYNTSQTMLPRNTYNIHRLGIKTGFTISDDISQQFGIGLFYNMPSSNKDLTWVSPVGVNNISFNISWVVGIPF